MRRAGWAGLMVVAALLAGCHRRLPPGPPPAPVAYVLEPAYQAGGVWFYPRETFSLDETGIGTILGRDHDALTADNERYDPHAMAAAMQSVQLPAIATVTNLENGRQVVLRVNDRGPTSPHRLIAVTPRVAALLGFGGGDRRVRVVFDPVLSSALARQVRGAAGDLAVSAAPRGDVRQDQLAPLAGTAQESARAVRGTLSVAQAGPTAAVTVPPRIAENVQAGAEDPGVLMIDGGHFTHENSARRRTIEMQDVGARMTRSSSGGQTSYDVRVGPFEDLATADAALDRIIENGIIDARIVVAKSSNGPTRTS